MRFLVVMMFLRLACRPARQWAATAFVLPTHHHPGALLATAFTTTTTQRWMGTQQQEQPVQERTPEEKERIKAEREARK